jgi:plasmid stability protein
MASMTIRNMDDGVKEKIRIRAAKNGRSMEEEARCILGSAVGKSSNKKGLGTAIRKRFAAVGSFTLEPLPRESMRDPPKF